MYWFGTLNNWVEAERVKMQTCIDVSYQVIGEEVGEQGTPHLQFYVEFPMKKHTAWMKSHYAERAHYELRKGSPKQASDYCKKDGKYWEQGEISKSGGKGKRNDLVEAFRAMQGGATAEEMLEQHGQVYIRNLRQLKAVQFEVAKDRDFKPQVYYIYGETETGKTSSVHAIEKDLFVHYDRQGKWHDGYHGQEAFLEDEFIGNADVRIYNAKYDRYAFSLETKGGMVKFNSKRIYICSNFSITQIAEKNQWTREEEAQFRRRIDKVFHYYRQAYAVDDPRYYNPIAPVPVQDAQVIIDVDVDVDEAAGEVAVDD